MKKNKLVNLPKEDIRKFLVNKQLLLRRNNLSGQKGIDFVFNKLRCLQYDTLNPCGRSIDLALNSRVKNIKTSDYFKWLYDEKNGIEVYDKELCVIPLEDIQLRGGEFPPARRLKLDKFIAENRTELNKLLEYIKKNGPICSLDYPVNNKIDQFWSSARWSKVALDCLWKNGDLVIANRNGGRKYFELPKKIYKNEFKWIRTKQNNDIIIRRLISTGLLPKTGTGSGWLGVGSGKKNKNTIEKLIRTGDLSEITIEGLKKQYVVLSRDLDQLKGISKLRYKKKISFLSPLDNLIWDRQMIKDIFEFDYKWEVYTPLKLRRYGYYTLPILYGTNFIGRIEPVYNESINRLCIKGLWLEESTIWDVQTSKAFTKCLGEFKKYLGADRIIWECVEPLVKQ